jgi:Transcriptional regulators
MIKKTLDTSILLGLYETAMLLIQQNVEFVSKQGLTNQQWVILIHLAKDPNLPFLSRHHHDKPLMASELADSLGVTRANITNIISILMDKGFINQVEDKEDRRKKRLILTARGDKLISNMQPGRMKSNAKMLLGLSDDEKKQFLTYIQKCTENIQNLKTQS